MTEAEAEATEFDGPHPMIEAFRKAEEWTNARKHVTTSDFAKHALFPLLRKMWNAHVEHYEELAEELFGEGEGGEGGEDEEFDDEGGAIIATEFLDSTFSLVMKFQQMVDYVLVKAGLAEAGENGTINTTKLPEDVARMYGALAADFFEWAKDFNETRAEAAEVEAEDAAAEGGEGEEEEAGTDAVNGHDAAATPANGDANAGA